MSTGLLPPDPDFTVFNMKFFEGEDQTFMVQTPVVPKVIAALRQCMLISEQERAAHGSYLADEDSDYRSGPLVVTEVSNSGRNSEANMMGLQLMTDEQIPVDLAMTPEVALKVAKAIMDQLGDAIIMPAKLDG